ncbi:MAG: GFA family protein [Pseudomonadota bacterium]
MPSGACLCGAVRITVEGPLSQPDLCHCSICRKYAAVGFASCDMPRDRVHIDGEDAITWYQSSDKVRRGFCSRCGSALFFDPLFHDWTAIAMGVFDEPTGTTLGKHIFTGNKGDYYTIEGDLPQNVQ